MIRRMTCVICCGLMTVSLAAAVDAASFQAGFAEVDITPPPGLPMWGFGARHALPATGTIDPLAARAVVIHAGDSKVAIAGLDLGRGPTSAMMNEIRLAVKEEAGIDHVLVSGTHTHHGPVIELRAKKGYGQDSFPEAVRYNQSLPAKIIQAIVDADRAARPARMGIGTRDDLTLNRNRHSKRQPKAIDSRLTVIRFDDDSEKPIAAIVSFAAHPVLSETMDLRWSADYPGYLVRKVQAELGGGCVFMQGASGDMGTRPPEGHNSVQAYGELLATKVLELAPTIETSVPESPSVCGLVDQFRFRSRVDFTDLRIQLAYSAAFFPALIRSAIDEFSEGIPAELNSIVLNGNVAMVGGSGEFFCSHAVRLRQRAHVDHTLFFGYCNGHSLYFPTIEAVSEGGYGADETVSPVEVGAGEQMMNRALINIYSLTGRIKTQPAHGNSE